MKDFSKSDVVDVMDTFQHAISIIEKESQEPYILAEGNGHRKHEQHHGSSHQKQDLKVKSLHGYYTEIIEDAASRVAHHTKAERTTFYRVRQRMSDYVRKLLQDARKRSRGKCSRNRSGKRGLNTW